MLTISCDSLKSPSNKYIHTPYDAQLASSVKRKKRKVINNKRNERTSAVRNVRSRIARGKHGLAQLLPHHFECVPELCLQTKLVRAHRNHARSKCTHTHSTETRNCTRKEVKEPFVVQFICASECAVQFGTVCAVRPIAANRLKQKEHERVTFVSMWMRNEIEIRIHQIRFHKTDGVFRSAPGRSLARQRLPNERALVLSQ